VKSLIKSLVKSTIYLNGEKSIKGFRTLATSEAFGFSVYARERFCTSPKRDSLVSFEQDKQGYNLFPKIAQNDSNNLFYASAHEQTLNFAIIFVDFFGKC
jgi:hypothetical protein